MTLRAPGACPRLPLTRMPSQAMPPQLLPGVRRLAKRRRGFPVDEEGERLWATRDRSSRHQCTDLASGAVKPTDRWQADLHRRRAGIEERHGSTAVPRRHRPAAQLLRAVVLSVKCATAEPTVTEKPSWPP